MTKEFLEEAVRAATNMIDDDEKWNAASPEKKLICVLVCLSGVACEELGQGKLSLEHVNALGGFAMDAINEMKELPILPSVPVVLN